MNEINRWTKIATYGPYGLWSNTHKGAAIYQARLSTLGQPTAGSGGYFNITSALKQKGLR